MSRVNDGMRIAGVEDDSTAAEWRRVHNTIVPPHQLSPADVRERAARHHLAVAYAGDPEVVVGCSTVRPPGHDPDDADAENGADGADGGARLTATVIARILPEYRGRGFGTRLYESCLAHARALGADTIETVVLASNEDGLRFAVRRGFVEFERYVLDGDTVPYITLRLSDGGA